MKPREFDDLIRQKFDQGDFEYNPAGWEKLEGQMDRKATRRKILMWLPLAPIAYISSIAASMAMIIAIPVLMQHSSSQNEMPGKLANLNSHTVQQHTSPMLQDNTNSIAVLNNDNVQLTKKEEITGNIHLSLDLNNNEWSVNKLGNNWNRNSNKSKMSLSEFNNAFAGEEYLTDASGADSKHLPASISIIGGYNTGSGMNGYSIGANGKKMLNDRFYVEGDVSFVDNSGIQNKLDPSVSTASLSVVYPIQIADNNANTTQSIVGNTSVVQSMPVNSISNSSTVASNMVASKSVLHGARLTYDPSTTTPTATQPNPVLRMPDIHRIKYDLYYAQVTPAIGYHLYKNLSVGVGADVQRLLEGENNMSTNPSATTASDIAADNKLVPGFDIGLVGKTEVTLSDKIRASVYYRQGMNNVITPGNKYIDRSYLQIHLKYTLFKK